MTPIILFSLFVLFVKVDSVGDIYYVRLDGGTRYSADVPTGQCSGLADAPYPGGSFVDLFLFDH